VLGRGGQGRQVCQVEADARRALGGGVDDPHGTVLVGPWRGRDRERQPRQQDVRPAPRLRLCAGAQGEGDVRGVHLDFVGRLLVVVVAPMLLLPQEGVLDGLAEQDGGADGDAELAEA